MPKLANPTQPMRWGNSTPKSLVGGGNWDFIYFFGVELGVLNVFHMVPSSSHQVPNGYLLCFSVASSIWFLQVPTQVPSSKFTYSEFRFSVGGGGSRFETDSVNPTPQIPLDGVLQISSLVQLLNLVFLDFLSLQFPIIFTKDLEANPILRLGLISLFN